MNFEDDVVMKRVLCIVSSLNAGGAETFLMKLYRTFDLNEYQMDFVVNVEGIYDSEVKQRGGKVYTTPLRTNHPLKSFWALKNVVSKGEYNFVLKLCDTPIGLVDIIAAKLGGATKVGVRSCNASADIGFAKRMLCAVMRPLFNWMLNYKIAPSELAARFTFGDKEFEKGNVQLLHNGINLDEYRFDEAGRVRIRSEFSLDRPFVVGHIGRFSKQKNHAFLLSVFREIVKRRNDAVLMLVGSGELENNIKSLVKEYDILDRVIFTGTRSDVPALLSAMDVFVFPSFFEGMPNTVIEAQACGLPCVISDSITQEAQLTGLVSYLSLKEDAAKWADVALSQSRTTNDKITEEIASAGYSIDQVTNRFCEIVFEGKT